MFTLSTMIRDISGSGGAVLLLSGGRDSAIVGLVLTAVVPFVLGLSIDYPGRPVPEREAADRLATVIGIPIHHEGLNVADGRTTRPELTGTSYEAWFPFRNLIFFSIAAGHAVNNDLTVVAGGIRASDNRAFSDSGLSYLEAFTRLLNHSGLPKADEVDRKLFLPLLAHEGQASKLLDEAGVSQDRRAEVLGTARSCWRSEKHPCGECVACRTALDV